VAAAPAAKALPAQNGTVEPDDTDRRGAALVRHERHRVHRALDELGRVGRVQQAIKNGAHIGPYIGHDEPATLFYSNQPGSASLP
jgi:hypothetical protein